MRRFKKTIKIGALVLGLLLVLLLIANAIFISITGSRLEKHLAAIRAAGDPVTLADLKRPLPPPEQNAATYVSRAREAEKAFDKETDPVLGSDAARPYEEQMKAVRAGFAAYPGIIPLMQQAADCPDCNLDLPYDANPSDGDPCGLVQSRDCQRVGMQLSGHMQRTDRARYQALC